mmetsp:Transcript_113106/g.325148  ORF Transcript_113106/g.325148 Transcript_113106/m.325148 type:complete len:318 (-) Transcript_113106:170-1123(-)
MASAASGAVALSNSLVRTARLEKLIIFGLALGTTLMTLHSKYAKNAEEAGGRVAKVFVEFQRKAFHMIGGSMICASYHWGIKKGLLTSAFQSLGGATEAAARAGKNPMDAGVYFLGASMVCWMVEAARLMCPSVQKLYLGSFKGLIRQKEINKAAGIAYFLPGALAAMLAAPSNIANLGILFLSIGDAAASIGTAAGSIPVGTSSRKVEGSIGCFAVCSALGVAAGLPSRIAMSTSAVVSLGEVLAEVIGLDDNFVIPMLTVLGLRLSLNAQLGRMVAVMGGTLGAGVLLGAVVGSTTPAARKAALEDATKESKKAA